MLIEAAQPCGPVFWQTHHPQVRHPMPSNLVLGAIYSITFFPMIVFRFSTPIVAGEVPQNVRGLKTLPEHHMVASIQPKIPKNIHSSLVRSPHSGHA